MSDEADDNVFMASTRIILPPSVIKALREAGATEVDKGDEPDKPFTTPHLSFSQLYTYMSCSWKYFLKYERKLPDKPSVSLALGKGGHAALEKNMKRKIARGTDSPTEEVVQWASDFMDHEMRVMPPSEYEVDVEPGSTKDRFLAATRVFQNRDAPDIKPVGVEVSFDLDLNDHIEPLDEPMRPIVGKIDLIYDDTKKLVVHEKDKARVSVEDYKFVARRRSQAEVDISPQLTLYNSVIKKVTGKWPTKTGYRMMLPGNTKEGPNAVLLERDPALMTNEKMEARMRRLALQFRQAEYGIRKGVFAPTDNPITCSWCPFRERCQDSLVDDFEAAQIRSRTNGERT